MRHVWVIVSVIMTINNDFSESKKLYTWILTGSPGKPVVPLSPEAPGIPMSPLEPL